ncbi:MAG: nucleotidyl transferase AbiEii/AbiGii toxin family protein [Desulfococcaceae bacterium]|jgi:hypothetical protein|nr:nucleotidyl transferase AbiEii/AbiGii toxin family protein [Desulfococcaceae bacterium]
MNSLFQAALELQQTMKSQNWPFCFIGGLAVIRWGEVRMTQDIDLCLMCGFGNEEAYIENLIKQYKSRIDEPVNFALNNRVLLLSASNGVSVDISLSGLPFEEEMIRKATHFKFSPDCSLITCSAEDLIVLKAFADRPKDWNDVETIAMRQDSNLDIEYITEQLTPLCDLKESPEIIEKLKKMLQK